MGCDYFYRGSLNDHRLQEKVVEREAQFWSNGMWIHPEPKAMYVTLRETTVEEDSPSYQVGPHPFNFFGFVPFPESYSLQFGQIVFDRSDGGRLVTLEKLPAVYGIEDADPNSDRMVEVSVKRGGYCRGPTGYGFALLLCVIKRRYFPGLRAGDDYNVFDETEYLVNRLRIADRIMDEKLTLDDCYALFETAYEKYSAKRARRKGAEERLARMKEARRRRLEGEEQGEEPTIVNPFLDPTVIEKLYEKALAEVNARTIALNNYFSERMKKSETDGRDEDESPIEPK